MLARGSGGAGGIGKGGGTMLRDPSVCPNGGVPLRDGSGLGDRLRLRDPSLCPNTGQPAREGADRGTTYRGNPNSTGTPLEDGSGKLTAPGKGAKDGSGNRVSRPTPPKS